MISGVLRFFEKFKNKVLAVFVFKEMPSPKRQVIANEMLNK